MPSSWIGFGTIENHIFGWQFLTASRIDNLVIHSYVLSFYEEIISKQPYLIWFTEVIEEKNVLCEKLFQERMLRREMVCFIISIMIRSVLNPAFWGLLREWNQIVKLKYLNYSIWLWYSLILLFLSFSLLGIDLVLIYHLFYSSLFFAYICIFFQVIVEPL